MARGGITRPERWVVRQPGYGAVKGAGEMGALLVRTVRLAAHPPYKWGPDFFTEASVAFRRCALPLTISQVFFALGLGIVYFGGIVGALGTLDRIGGGTQVAWTREISVWLTTMILAGVAGSAITADLAARKVRDELDALSVLGVEVTRALVIPRVLAMTIITPLLGLYAVLLASVVLYGVTITYFSDSLQAASFRETYFAFVQIGDLVTFVIKMTLVGAFIGLVSCYKGLSTRQGAEGVGRAVNESVLIMFFGIWTLNTLFNMAYLALDPNVGILRG
jgi:phospholipid/cholesterol/gamma-HCH transport system permease protein